MTMTREIVAIKKNGTYALAGIPKAYLRIASKDGATLNIEIEVWRTIMYKETVRINPDDCIGIWNGTIYAFPNRDTDSWIVDNVTPIYNVPFNRISEISYKIEDIRNCMGCGCYSLDFAIEYFGRLLELNPCQMKALLTA